MGFPGSFPGAAAHPALTSQVCLPQALPALSPSVFSTVADLIGEVAARCSLLSVVKLLLVSGPFLFTLSLGLS